MEQSTFSTLRETLDSLDCALNRGGSADNLQSYLDFYALPKPHSQLTVAAGTLAVGQTTLFAAAWQPSKSVGTAIIVHGYLDHLGLYGHLIRYLLDRNMAVVCFDLPGHGLSDGEPAYIGDFAEYTDALTAVIDVCRANSAAPLHGLGQSMGGAILLKHLINTERQDDYPFDSLNLFAPLLHPKGWSISRRLIPLFRPFRKSIKRVFRPSSYDREFLDFLRLKDPLQPRTIPLPWLIAADKWAREFQRSVGSDFPINLIQGTADGTLDWQYNLRVFRDKLPGIQVQIIDTANHHLVNEIESLRRDIFAAIHLG